MRLVIRGNGEKDNKAECFSPVSDFTVIKILLCLEIQRKGYVRHVDFQEAFSNGNLERPVYAELSKYQIAGSTWESNVLLLRRTLYELRDAARSLFNFLNGIFESVGLKQLKTALFIFHGKT